MGIRNQQDTKSQRQNNKSLENSNNHKTISEKGNSIWMIWKKTDKINRFKDHFWPIIMRKWSTTEGRSRWSKKVKKRYGRKIFLTIQHGWGIRIKKERYIKWKCKATVINFSSMFNNKKGEKEMKVKRIEDIDKSWMLRLRKF